MENIGTPINDRQLTTMAVNGMISPFVPELMSAPKSNPKNKVISYGLSSAGYDVRLGLGAMSPSGNPNMAPAIDPKVSRPEYWGKLEPQTDEGGDFYLILPNQFLLATTVEYIRMPKNVVGLVFNKSSYVRNGIWMPNTVLEPAWEGNLTLEIKNVSPLKVKLYINEGIAQIIFTMIEQPMVTYADRSGKYQKQKGVTLSR